MAIFIREEEVRSLFTMREAVEVVQEVFRLKGTGLADNPPRQRPRLERAMFQVMPAAVKGVGLGLKAYTITPGGVRFAVLLFDEETGELLTIVEANELGRIRTGAASGVATKFLSRTESSTVGIFGSGFQADTQLEAICAVRPITTAYVYSRSEANRAAFAERTADRLGIEVRPTGKPEECAQCDVIATITNAAEPLFAASMLSEGAHINAAGSNRAQAAEIGPDTIELARRVVIDDRAQGQVESGDLIRAVEAGKCTWESVEELADVVAGTRPGRESASEITIFESLGVAIEDVAAARRVYELAMANGAGEKLPSSILG